MIDTSQVLPRLKSLLSKPFFSDRRTLLGLWSLIALLAGLTKLSLHRHNNFEIFRGVYHHLVQQLSLYAEYPAEYFDSNHYGPFFSLVIAPFALVPDGLGLVMWVLALALGLYWAIRYLPARDAYKVFVYWFCAHELLTALQMQQFNVAIAAIIVGTFVAVERKQEWLAALLIVVGTFVKLYGIVGLAFFFFVKRKPLFILWLAIWSLVCLTAPMLISSPDYVLGQYVEWFDSLTHKNEGNAFSLMQNISLLGMLRKISGSMTYSDLWVILPGLALFGIPYLRIKQYRYLSFRYAFLASVLLFVVLFSTGSESSSYIIAFVGIVLWYVLSPRPRKAWDLALMIGAFILSSLSPSDLFPRALREAIVQPYALKALFPALIWLRLSYEMCTQDYSQISLVSVGHSDQP